MGLVVVFIWVPQVQQMLKAVALHIAIHFLELLAVQ
jgi:hypothetical protein